MPYRDARFWLLALFPLIIISFWPGYFGHLAGARWAQHAHGASATAWLALLTLQSWSAHRRHFGWHRAAGLAVFAVVPVFAAAGLYGVYDMAAQMNAGSPFEAFAAPALAPDDLMSIVALVGFVAMALTARRSAVRHAAWMLATALLVLPPMTTRLIQVAVRFAGLQPPSLWVSFLLGQSVTILLALILVYRRPAQKAPFVVLGALTLAQTASYQLLGPDTGWRAALSALGNTTPLPGALGAAVLSLATLVLAWRTVPPKSRSVPLGRAVPNHAAP